MHAVLAALRRKQEKVICGLFQDMAALWLCYDSKRQDAIYGPSFRTWLLCGYRLL